MLDRDVVAAQLARLGLSTSGGARRLSASGGARWGCWRAVMRDGVVGERWCKHGEVVISFPQRSQGQKCPMGIPGLPRRRQRHLRQSPL
jgi:hypothetical protein